MKIETENKEFKPVKLVFETQGEVDKLFALVDYADDELFIKYKDGLRSDRFFTVLRESLYGLVDCEKVRDDYEITDLSYGGLHSADKISKTITNRKDRRIHPDLR